LALSGKISDFIIPGEEAEIRRLTYGIPFEYRATACFIRSKNNPPKTMFDRLVDRSVEQYPDTRLNVSNDY